MIRRHFDDDEPPPSEAALEAAANMQQAILEERLRTQDALKGIGPGPTMKELRTRGDRMVVRIAVGLAGLIVFVFVAGVFGFVFGLVSQR
jgi:hypothetical protein